MGASPFTVAVANVGRMTLCDLCINCKTGDKLVGNIPLSFAFQILVFPFSLFQKLRSKLVL